MRMKFNTMEKYHRKISGRIGGNAAGFYRYSSPTKIRSFLLSLHLNRPFRMYFSIGGPGAKPITIGAN